MPDGSTCPVAQVANRYGKNPQCCGTGGNATKPIVNPKDNTKCAPCPVKTKYCPHDHKCCAGPASNCTDDGCCDTAPVRPHGAPSPNSSSGKGHICKMKGGKTTCCSGRWLRERR